MGDKCKPSTPEAQPKKCYFVLTLEEKSTVLNLLISNTEFLKGFFNVILTFPFFALGTEFGIYFPSRVQLLNNIFLRVNMTSLSPEHLQPFAITPSNFIYHFYIFLPAPI